MSALQLLSGPQGQRLGLTLLHFIWQGIAVVAIAAATVFLLRLRPGRQRYYAYLLAFAAMFACPIITYIELPMSMTAATHHDAAPTATISRSFAPGVDTGAPEPTGLAMSAPDTATRRINWRDAAGAWLAAGLPWALAAWAVGVMLLGIRLLMGLAGIHRWKSTARRCRQSCWIARNNWERGWALKISAGSIPPPELPSRRRWAS